MLPLILASSSQYRGQILAKLTLPFTSQAANIDESSLNNESACQLVKRLSLAKAEKIAQNHPQHLIIGSDQVAEVGGRILTKPNSPKHAQEQLALSSGKEVVFSTGLALLNTKTGRKHYGLETTTVTFRELSTLQIERYLEAEQPYDCAGSFKSEALGILLIDRIQSRDPNSLIGLPLILLIDFLYAEGVNLPLTPRPHKTI
ncbi:MAG: septum formation inhibitor Maf [Gammaproteobacteria bacterium]|nr:MAG: septum formation inhibitor Maf [Gammaproteobacteria bacterium]